MDIEIGELPGGITHIGLIGRLDAAGADRVGTQFTAAVVAKAQPALVDLAGVSFVASMGLRLIIATAKGMRSKGAGFVLYGAQPLVAETLEQAALGQIVPIVATRAEALALLAG